MAVSPENGNGQRKFIIGGILIGVAIIFLIFTATRTNSEYFLTVDEVLEQGTSLQGKSLRVSGAVIGSSIEFNPDSMQLKFLIAHVPGDNSQIEEQGGLAAALHAAVTDPSRARLVVHYDGPKPDLLSDEAQAILTGHLMADGSFLADELLLKCPSKYQEAVPSQVVEKN